MGGRETQFIGHCDQARKVIDQSRLIGNTGEIITGMFGETIHECKKYQDPDGDIWIEYEQCAPWSSGPMIFMALKSDHDKIEWSQKDIDAYLD